VFPKISVEEEEDPRQEAKGDCDESENIWLSKRHSFVIIIIIIKGQN